MTILNFQLQLQYTAGFTKLFTLGEKADLANGIIDLKEISPDKKGLYEAIIATSGDLRGKIVQDVLKCDPPISLPDKRYYRLTTEDIQAYYNKLQQHIPKLTYEDFIFLVSNSSGNSLISIPESELKTLLNDACGHDGTSGVIFDGNNTLRLEITDNPKRRTLSCECVANLKMGNYYQTTHETIFMSATYSMDDPNTITYKLIDQTTLGKYLISDENSELRKSLLNDPNLVVLYYTALSGNVSAHEKFIECAGAFFQTQQRLFMWRLSVYLAFSSKKREGYSHRVCELLKQAPPLSAGEKELMVIIIKPWLPKLLKHGTEEDILYLLNCKDFAEKTKGYYSIPSNLDRFFKKNFQIDPVIFFAKYADIFDTNQLFNVAILGLQEQVTKAARNQISKTFEYKTAVMFLQNSKLCLAYLQKNPLCRYVLKVVLAIELKENFKNCNRNGFFSKNLFDQYLNCAQLFTHKENVTEELEALAAQFSIH